MKNIYLFLLIFILSACGPAHHLRQAERHIRKAEQLGASIRVDTVYISKEIVVPELRTDTLVKTVNFRDTLFLDRDRIKIKLRIDTLKKVVYISVKCPPDTLKIEVPINVIREIKPKFPWWYLVAAFVCGGFVVYLIRRK